MSSWAHFREGQGAAVAPPALGDRKGMHPVSSCSRAWVSSHRWQGRGPIAVETDVICVSKGGGFVSPSVSSTLTIELAQESVTGKFVQHRDVTGARWTLDSGVSSWCMLLVSFELREIGFESVESFRRGSLSASASLDSSGRDGV